MPTALMIKTSRKRANLTQAQAAHLVGTRLRTWQNWETPEFSQSHRRIPQYKWDLFLMATGQQETDVVAG